MSVDHRNELLHRLIVIARKLPNGLLVRLVDDAQFFYDWNLGKKRARASSRLAQYTRSTNVGKSNASE